jgi:hypothetical protein
MANNSLPLRETHSQAGTSWNPYIIAALILYPILCSYLRFQRRDAMHKKFSFPTKASLSNMTNVEAQQITQYVGELEFPKIYEVALQFALFRVSISPIWEKSQ